MLHRPRVPSAILAAQLRMPVRVVVVTEVMATAR